MREFYVSCFHYYVTLSVVKLAGAVNQLHFVLEFKQEVVRIKLCKLEKKKKKLLCVGILLRREFDVLRVAVMQRDFSPKVDRNVDCSIPMLTVVPAVCDVLT